MAGLRGSKGSKEKDGESRVEREALSQQQLLSLGLDFKPCWRGTVFSVSPCFPSFLPLLTKKVSFLAPS